MDYRTAYRRTDKSDKRHDDTPFGFEHRELQLQLVDTGILVVETGEHVNPPFFLKFEFTGRHLRVLGEFLASALAGHAPSPLPYPVHASMLA